MISCAGGFYFILLYYSAGYKDGNKDQNPYNISRLLHYIVENIPEGKRPLVVENINGESLINDTHENKRKEQEKIEKSISDSLADFVGSAFDKVTSTIKSVAGVVVSVGRAVLSWFGW